MSEQWKKGLLASGWTVRAAVEFAIDVEKTAQRLYRELATRWEYDPVLRGLFTHVAREEAAHEEDLRKLLGGVGPSRAEGELHGESLEAIAHAAFFSRENGFFGGIEQESRPLRVLEAVLSFERGTALYYRGLRDVLGPTAILDTMIAEERQHAASVRRAIDAYAASRGCGARSAPMAHGNGGEARPATPSRRARR